MQRLLPGEHALHVLADHHRHPQARPARGTPGVRREHHVVELEQPRVHGGLLLEHVEPRTAEVAAPQRVGYRLQARPPAGTADRKIELLLWPQLDMPPRAGPEAYAALSNVADLKLRVLDAQGNWQTRWPVPTAGGAAPVALPNGLEVAITLSSGETVTRLFAMRGSQS